MKILTIATALLLAGAPTVALATCAGHDDRAASSCKEGYVWDAASQACAPQTTS